MSFSKSFVWGVASASYQTEGAAFEDGKGLSIWDTFSHIPGKTFNGHNGDVACDAYHHYEEDLDIMKSLGIKAYRFSVSWPRVIPNGTGDINPLGLDFYDHLVDGCIERGIEPWITLYHWDLPLELYKKGGWLNRETAIAFGEYAAIITEHFKDRVSHYLTLNEPQCAVGLGYMMGAHAPGLQLSMEEGFLAWHNMMLAHGMATTAIRSVYPEAIVGLASTGNLNYLPETGMDIPNEVKELSFTLPVNAEAHAQFFNHQWFLDPVCLGHYPDDPNAPWTVCAKAIDPIDLEIIHQRPDFIGLNIYNGHELTLIDGAYTELPKYEGFPRTALKWPVTPEILYWGPKQIHDRYQLPVAIVENGQSGNDRIYLDGKVHDPDRIDFLHRYLRELKKLTVEDIPLLGYFQWSFCDNLEWHSGYDERFGIVYVDYRTQQRIPKDSAYWYSEVIKSNGEIL